MTKRKFIKKTIEYYDRHPLTAAQARAAANKFTIGADGKSMALTLAWLHETAPRCFRNKVSNWLLMLWLGSCMRKYADFGNFDPIAACVVKRYYTLLAEKLEREEREREDNPAR